MRQSWICFLVAALASTANAVKCADIGWADGSRDGKNQRPSKNPDLFAKGRGWDVVKAEDCWIRWQTSQGGKEARITQTAWTATPDEVLHTMNNYGGSSENIMLWFRLSRDALQYAGYVKNTGVPIIAQSGLTDPSTVITLILPSGVKKLTEVHQPPGSHTQQNKAIWAHGAKGTIATTDYAYTSMVPFTWAVNAKMMSYIDRKDLDRAWITAETSDPNKCVVIDFRTVPGLAYRPVKATKARRDWLRPVEE